LKQSCVLTYSETLKVIATIPVELELADDQFWRFALHCLAVDVSGPPKEGDMILARQGASA
jgi:hypothetical protein